MDGAVDNQNVAARSPPSASSSPHTHQAVVCSQNSRVFSLGIEAGVWVSRPGLEALHGGQGIAVRRGGQ